MSTSQTAPVVVPSQVPTHWYNLVADLPVPRSQPARRHQHRRVASEPSAIAVDQADAFKAGVEFARAEGLIPAPESTHAVAGAIARARAATTEETIVLGLSGNGVLDLPAYHDFA